MRALSGQRQKGSNLNLRDKLSRIPSLRSRQWNLRPEILLCGNVPQPLHGVAPRVVLGEKWWGKVKREAYRSTGFHCVACGVSKFEARFHEWLEAHEVYKVDHLLGRMYYKETVPLCHACHAYIHSGRLAMLLGKRQISGSRYSIIMRHGDKVLRNAGLSKKKPTDNLDEGPAWGEWRLVVDGVEYEPKFKTFEQWKAAFDD